MSFTGATRRRQPGTVRRPECRTLPTRYLSNLEGI